MVFKKRYPQNPVSLSNGKAVRFEDLGNETGFFVTDDPVIISEFQACMQAGRGGIEVSSTEEHNAAVKKKSDSPNFNNSSIRERQTAGLVTIVAAPPVVASPVASVAASPVPPVVAPSTIPEPVIPKVNTAEPVARKRIPKTS